MVHFDLIQGIGSDMLCRLLQIADSACVSVQLDNGVKAVRSQHALVFMHTDPLQNFRKRIF